MAVAGGCDNSTTHCRRKIQAWRNQRNYIRTASQASKGYIPKRNGGKTDSAAWLVDFSAFVTDFQIGSSDVVEYSSMVVCALKAEGSWWDPQHHYIPPKRSHHFWTRKEVIGPGGGGAYL